jgi:hypothetical protein
MADKLLRGWKEIADFLRMSERTIRRRRLEFLRRGVIFYQHYGNPPSKYVCAFTSTLRKYLENHYGKNSKKTKKD